MKDMVKKYLPYTVIIFAIYIVVPLLFRSGASSGFVGVAWYFIFPATAAVTAAVFCSKYGLDFLFSLIAPILFLPSMFLYYGGINLSNIILLIVYLVAGIFGLFLGDIALGDKRREREKREKEIAEEMLLEAKRRDEREREKMVQKKSVPRKQPSSTRRSSTRQESRQSYPRSSTRRSAASSYGNSDYDDFDYDKYLDDADRKPTSTESEIDDILSEFGKH